MLTVGADPELFLRRTGELVPAGVVTPGTKDHPIQVGEGYAVHADNVCLEFNIPPAKSREEFIRYVARGLEICRDTAHDCELLFLPATEFTQAQFEMVGAEAMLFHCNPEAKLWGGDDEECINWRVAGGHIHIGAEIPSVQQFAASCDYHMGLRGVIYEDSQLAAIRRKYYGKAGAYRQKDYGIEYRTLSNFWLQSQELTGKVYDWAKEAVDKIGDTMEYMSIIDPMEMVEVINQCDKRRAEQMLRTLGLTC